MKISIKGNRRDGSFSASKDIVFPREEYTKNLGVQRAWAKCKIDSLSELVSEAVNEEVQKITTD